MPMIVLVMLTVPSTGSCLCSSIFCSPCTRNMGLNVPTLRMAPPPPAPSTTAMVGSACWVTSWLFSVVNSSSSSGTGRGRAAGAGVGLGLGDEVGDDLAEIVGIPAGALVDTRAVAPALGHIDVPAHDVEHPAGDVARLGASQPHDEGRDVVGVGGV